MSEQTSDRRRIRQAPTANIASAASVLPALLMASISWDLDGIVGNEYPIERGEEGPCPSSETRLRAPQGRRASFYARPSVLPVARSPVDAQAPA
jgi:hypothetical protein